MTPRPIPFPVNLQAIVFDVDGTLYRQGQLRILFFAHLLPGFLRRPLHARRVSRVLKLHRRALENLRDETAPCDIADRQLKACCSGSGLPRETVEPIVKHYFEEMPLRFLKECLRPGLQTFLASARDGGKLLGIVSDYPADAKLRAIELTNHFDAVVSASYRSIGRLKPHPAALIECLERLGIKPANAVYVGDRVDVDVPCALNAGVHPIVIGNVPPSAQYSRVKDVRELSQLCSATSAATEVPVA